MPLRIEDYALIGDLQSAALVGKNGSIDWLCLPRFDSAAAFCALLGNDDNGHWIICPEGEYRARRRYLPDTLVLETEMETASGVVRVLDFMPPRSKAPDVVRIVVGVRGSVQMKMRCVLRFDYGRTVPWVTHAERGIVAIAGPDCVTLESDVPLQGVGLATEANFEVREGQRVPFVLTWHPSHEPRGKSVEPEGALQHAIDIWRAWSAKCVYEGPYREAVVRSLITLKALTYQPTGGLVAAVTTSLPEQWGGPRNWDYRFCWLRDATFTLFALIKAGFTEEAVAWRDWLVRAIAGAPSQLQIMYGLSGERRLPELTLDWLSGYEGARPVRIGNAAHEQLQLDIFGEVMALLYLAAQAGMKPNDNVWSMQCHLLEQLETVWQEPDEGIWEVRGARQHFTHSKVMAWWAFDRGIKTAEEHGLRAPLARWRATREAIHHDVCSKGYDAARNTFTRAYGSHELDASLLVLPHLSFLPSGDARVRGTVDAIRRELAVDGLLLRYTAADGLPPGEGAFLLCTFWLADDLALMGQHQEAKALFDHLLSLRNDVGLLSEQYDPRAQRMLGNYPQAFSHVALVNTAFTLAAAFEGLAEEGEREAEVSSARDGR